MNIAFLLPAVSCGASLLLCAALIPLLKKLRAGQYILGYVEEHKEKTGTPTMGGLAFIAAAALTIEAGFFATAPSTFTRPSSIKSCAAVRDGASFLSVISLSRRIRFALILPHRIAS